MATYYDPVLQALLDKAAINNGTSPLLTETVQKYYAPNSTINPATVPTTWGSQETGLSAAQITNLVNAGRTATTSPAPTTTAPKPATTTTASRTTSSPAPATAPAATTSTATKTLDSKTDTPVLPPPTSRSSLVEFADALNKATELARVSSRMNEMGILGQFGFEPGKVRAGTMGNILGLMETAFTDRVTPLQTAAQEAFKMKEEEKKSIQQLALDAMTKYGLDSTQVQSILAHGSLNEALVAIAPFIKEGGGFADIREVKDGNTSKLIGIREDGTVEDIWTGASSSSSNSEIRNINGEPHQVVTDANGNIISATRIESTAVSDYDVGVGFVANPIDANEKPMDKSAVTATWLRAELEGLDIDKDQVEALLDSFVLEPEAYKTKATELIVEFWIKDFWDKRSWDEFTNAKAAAKKDIDEYEQDIRGFTVTPEREKLLLQAINALTYDDVKGLI